MITVHKVDTSSKAQVRRFIRFSYPLYREDPIWVPPLMVEMEAQLDRQKFPFYEHSDADFFVAEMDGQDVGRIAVLENCLYNQHQGTHQANFYFFECIDDVDHYIDRLGHYFLADVNVTFSRSYRVERVTNDLLQVPGVKLGEGWTGAVAQLVEEDDTLGESVQLVAPPADSPLVEPMLLKGRWIQPGDQNAIALSELFLEYRPELKVGARFD